MITFKVTDGKGVLSTHRDLLSALDAAYTSIREFHERPGATWDEYILGLVASAGYGVIGSEGTMIAERRVIGVKG